MADKPRAFVIMPFSEEFSSVYVDVIRTAATAAGWEPFRIDEASTLGPIPTQYIEELFSADLVIAEVTTPNPNVFYELGLRHALSSGGTLLVAREGTTLPFDIAQQRVFFYADDPQGYAELRGQITAVLEAYEPDTSVGSNPVRSVLVGLGVTTDPGIDSEQFEQELLGRIGRAKTRDQLIAVWNWVRNFSKLPPFALLALAERLGDSEGWDTSVRVLEAADLSRPKDYEIVRTLGWHQSKLGLTEAARSSFEQALALNPNDPETLGMLGGLLKRLGQYEEAAERYAAGAALSPENLYMRVNEAAMLILRSPEDSEAGIAAYARLRRDIEEDQRLEGDVWAEVVLGECAFAAGEELAAQAIFRRAASITSSPKPLRSTAEQVDLLGGAGFNRELAGSLALFLGQLAGSILGSAVLADASPVPNAEANLPLIIHISDVHFGSLDKGGELTGMHRHRDDEGGYEKTLAAHMIDEFGSARRHFEITGRDLYLVVSGDLTYTASSSEFTEVKGFLEDVVSALGIPKNRVVIAPGNHDVHWPSSKIELGRRFDNYLVFLRNFYGEDLFREIYPLVDWDFQVDGLRPPPSALVGLHHHEGVTFASVNSCVYEDDQDHYGFVGNKQMGNVENLLDALNGHADDIRIAVLHHHLHPFPEPVISADPSEGAEPWFDVSTVRDAGHIEKRLEKLGFDIVLHGHKHQPLVRETLIRDSDAGGGSTPSLVVCGAGSVGVDSRELAHNQANHYEVLELLSRSRTQGTAFISIEWRELAVRPGAEWATSNRWTING